MTVPQDYTNAAPRFDALLVDMMDVLDLTTRHQVYAALFGVLRVFRARLDAEQVLVFAGGLPAMLRALFVADYDPAAPREPFATRDVYDNEARHVRGNHNLMPRGSIAPIAATIRRHCDSVAFDAALAKLPPQAAEFWAG